MPEIAIGCTYNFLQPREEASVDRRFDLVRETGAFDYLHWLPSSEQLAACVRASERTGLPMLTGNFIGTAGRDDAAFATALQNASRAGVRLVNVMLATDAADGHELSAREVADWYLRGADLGAKLGVDVALELHVDCWSEKYLRVEQVVEAVRAAGARFNLTLDYSHVIFKIGNPEQLELSGVREDVEAGRVVLDPFEPGSLCDRWLAMNVVPFAQFRPVAPSNPRNVWAIEENGGVLPRGIMYPFLRPGPGEWHSPWYAYLLEPCKEAMRHVLRHHASDSASPLRYVITEMIPQPDYGLNAKFSLLEHNAACARWIRETWQRIRTDAPIAV